MQLETRNTPRKSDQRSSCQAVPLSPAQLVPARLRPTKILSTSKHATGHRRGHLRSVSYGPETAVQALDLVAFGDEVCPDLSLVRAEALDCHWTVQAATCKVSQDLEPSLCVLQRSI